MLANRALAADGDASFVDVLRRSVTDPSVAWDPAGEIVGRTRFRPASMSLFAVERAVGGSHAGALAGGISLLLHIIVALGAAGLVRQIGASMRAAWLAGLLTAAAPVALAAAAWPARQPIALAAALGIVGVRLALGSGTGRLIAAGVTLALAGLSHELGYGAAAAALVLIGTGHGSGGIAAGAAARLRSAGLTALPVIAAIAWRTRVLSLVEIPESITSGAARPDFFDAVAGTLLTLITPLLPARFHLAGGPWLATPVARITSGLLLCTVAYLLARRARTPAAAVWLAALAAVVPVLFTSSSGGTPFHDGYAYVVLPLLAGGVALVVDSGARRGGALRLPSVAVGALLVGASVATTLTAAPSFRSAASFVELAARGDPNSAVARAWRLGVAMRAASSRTLEGNTADAAPAGDSLKPPAAALLALLPQALELADRLVEPPEPGSDGIVPTDEGARIARDAAAALSVASVLSAYASSVSALPPESLTEDSRCLLPEVVRVAEASAAVAPEWPAAWLWLAHTRTRVGAVGGALAAARRGGSLDPENVELAEFAARLALRVGRTSLAVSEIARASVLEQAAAERRGGALRRDHILLRAEALSADASARGVLVEFDWAARLLQPLWDAGDHERDVRSVLYDLYLRWGDALASLDRTAMARLAYMRAVALGGSGSDAADHLAWLEQRLRRELAEANAALERALSGEGNVANALLEVAIVLCRGADWKGADELFAKIEREQGVMNPSLRFSKAIHRHAARDDELAIAEAELRLVLD